MADTAKPIRVGYIGGDGVVIPDYGEWITVVNPATGETLAQLHEISATDLDTVIDQAHDAFTSVWRSTSPDERGRLIARWADCIEAHRDELADLEMADVGHLRSEVLGDIDSSVRTLRYFAGMADKIEGTTYAQVPGRLAYGLDEPFGVVAGISPTTGTRTLSR